jgi:hypothetical protein
MDAMHNARLAYGALIRTPIIGPLVRLPLRLVRWWMQPPDHDPSARTDRLAAELASLRDQYGQLALAHEALCQDQERTRLVLFMISGQLQPNADTLLKTRSAARLADGPPIKGDAGDPAPARSQQAGRA